MSGPVEGLAGGPVEGLAGGPVEGGTTVDETGPGPVEVVASRAVEVGGHQVRRALPQRPRRSVGPWCLVDHLLPSATPVQVGPHPHIGLHTVTWLHAGEVLHRDGLGSEQLIRPGELNVMSAGHGIAHAEEGRPGRPGHGVQLWVAQPEARRHGPPAFAHHGAGELPALELRTGRATVLAGTLAGTTSPAGLDGDVVGAELQLRAGTGEVALDPAFEHAVLVLEGAVEVEGHPVPTGAVAHLPVGRTSLGWRSDAGARVLLLGGVPFGERLLMWWNYVARSPDEISQAHRAWTADDGRFAPVASTLPRIETPPPPWEPVPHHPPEEPAP